jgi:hypothetical protein
MLEMRKVWKICLKVTIDVQSQQRLIASRIRLAPNSLDEEGSSKKEKKAKRDERNIIITNLTEG